MEPFLPWYTLIAQSCDTDVDNLMRLSREKLREVASQFLERARSTKSESDQRAALVFSAAALRSATRRSGAFTQDTLPECIQHASILGDLQDTEGAAYLLSACAVAVTRQPFAEEEQNLALLDYCANEAAALQDVRAAAAIRRAHHSRLVMARGADAPETAESGMVLAQVGGGSRGNLFHFHFLCPTSRLYAAIFVCSCKLHPTTSLQLLNLGAVRLLRSRRVLIQGTFYCENELMKEVG